MQKAHWARKSRKVGQGPTRHANRGKDRESTGVANKEKIGPGPIRCVNREEIGLYRDLTGISEDSTGISGNRTKSQKSSRRPSGTHQ